MTGDYRDFSPEDPSDELAVIPQNNLQIAKSVQNVELRALDKDASIDLSGALKLSFETLTAFGTAVASLPDQFRTVYQSIETPVGNLLAVTDKFGNPLDINKLYRFKDGSGILGSYRDVESGLHQARFHKAGPITSDIKTTMPYDPTMMFMAAALMQINQKLDSIQEVQEKMFTYLVQKDEAKLRGDLQTLRDVLENYQYNWENEIYKKNKHNLVQEIRRTSEQAINFYQRQLGNVFNGQGLFHFDHDVRAKLDEMLDKVKDYQVSLYLYAFSAFLEVLLLENFDAAYLDSVKGKIQTYADEYEQLYQSCYDAINELANSSVETNVLHGFAGLSHSFASFLESTPLKDMTPIDEALHDLGKAADSAANHKTDDLMSELLEAMVDDVTPFITQIEQLNSLHNEPQMLVVSDDAVYLLPESIENIQMPPVSFEQGVEVPVEKNKPDDEEDLGHQIVV